MGGGEGIEGPSTCSGHQGEGGVVGVEGVEGGVVEGRTGPKL